MWVGWTPELFDAGHPKILSSVSEIRCSQRNRLLHTLTRAFFVAASSASDLRQDPAESRRQSIDAKFRTAIPRPRLSACLAKADRKAGRSRITTPRAAGFSGPNSKVRRRNGRPPRRFFHARRSARRPRAATYLGRDPAKRRLCRMQTPSVKSPRQAGSGCIGA